MVAALALVGSTTDGDGALGLKGGWEHGAFGPLVAAVADDLPLEGRLDRLVMRGGWALDSGWAPVSKVSSRGRTRK